MRFSAEFVARLRAGEELAFAELMKETAGAVRQIVRKYHYSPFEQEEVIQEVWLTIFRKRERLAPELAANLDGWVATVARHRAIDFARARGRMKDPAAEEPPEPAPAHALIAQQDLREAVEEFVARMKPEWRAFFQLHFVDGLPYPDVSRRLGISRVRCKYMKRVLAAEAREHPALLAALGRYATLDDGGSRAP